MFESAVVYAVLEHLYGLCYGIPSNEPHAKFHAKVYFAGDYYQLPSLKSEAQFNFQELASIGGDRTFESKWRKRGSPKKLLDAAAVVYSVREEDRGLKNILINHIKSHVKALSDRSDESKQILKDVSGLAFDLLNVRIISDSDAAFDSISPSWKISNQVRKEQQRLVELDHLLDVDSDCDIDSQRHHLEYLVADANERQAKKRKRGD